ncbi:hypothetical protein GR199_26950 [Rhizobium leguminosarum]|nr:hypothetical protein [Rhizobium leguminosarum]
MPAIIYKQNPGLTPEDIAKVAVFADNVEKNCFDDFPEDGSRAVSERLARKVKDVLDAFRDVRQRPTEEAADNVMALDSHVGNYASIGSATGVLRVRRWSCYECPRTFRRSSKRW